MLPLLILLSLPATAIGSPSGHAGCRFPARWRGRWYQEGLGLIHIDRRHIERKGTCREHPRDYYIVKDREEGCHRCLVIMQRTENLLQYKESYCMRLERSESLQHICDLIRAEDVLYTLVRDGSAPIACPFHGAYHFRYNRDSNRMCTSSTSYVRRCANDSKLRLTFGRCNNIEATDDEVLDFECLATWKDGSGTFVYGLLASADETDKIYKCIRYQIVGETRIYMAMSADATCRGLDSARDGPLVMELTRDTAGLPLPSCIFPAWLSRTLWRDLSGDHVFTTDPRGQVMTLTTMSGAQARYAFRCIEIRVTSDEVVALSFTSDDCDVRYQCLKIRKRHRNILEIQIGSYMDQTVRECSGELTSLRSRHVVFPLGLEGTPCPYTGVYNTPTDQSNCRVNFFSGCNTTSQISIVSSCIANNPVDRLECLQTWTENERKYVVARLPGGGANSAVNCFSFQRRGRLLRFAVDRQCNSDVATIVTADFSYLLEPQPDACAEVIISPPTTRAPRRHKAKTIWTTTTMTTTTTTVTAAGVTAVEVVAAGGVTRGVAGGVPGAGGVARAVQTKPAMAFAGENVSVVSSSDLTTGRSAAVQWASCVVCFVVMVILAHR